MRNLIDRQDAIDVIMKHGKRIPTYAIACKAGLEALPQIETFEFGKWYDFQKGYVLEVNTEAFRISKEVVG